MTHHCQIEESKVIADGSQGIHWEGQGLKGDLDGTPGLAGDRSPCLSDEGHNLVNVGGSNSLPLSDFKATASLGLAFLDLRAGWDQTDALLHWVATSHFLSPVNLG